MLTKDDQGRFRFDAPEVPLVPQELKGVQYGAWKGLMGCPGLFVYFFKGFWFKGVLKGLWGVFRVLYLVLFLGLLGSFCRGCRVSSGFLGLL